MNIDLNNLINSQSFYQNSFNNVNQFFNQSFNNQNNNFYSNNLSQSYNNALPNFYINNNPNQEKSFFYNNDNLSNLKINNFIN